MHEPGSPEKITHSFILGLNLSSWVVWHVDLQKSNPLVEENSPTTNNSAERKRFSIFQERIRAECESFKAVFDKRRQRISGLDVDDDWWQILEFLMWSNFTWWIVHYHCFLLSVNQCEYKKLDQLVVKRNFSQDLGLGFSFNFLSYDYWQKHTKHTGD